MQHISEECWGRIEALRQRVKSVCTGEAVGEHASIDAEMIELREIVWAALKPLNEVGSPPSSQRWGA